VKLSIVGIGNLGGALAKRLIESGLSRSDMTLISRGSDRAQQISVALELPLKTALDCTEDEIVILAVKPQDIGSIRDLIVGKLPEMALILSFVAGVSCASLRRIFKHERIARAMPNLGVVVGESATSYFLPPELEMCRKRIEKLLKLFGLIFPLEDEARLEVSTAVAGSGPGYVSWLAEQLQVSAEQHGFESTEARRLVLQTIKAAVAYLESSGEDFSSLREKVTSPNGTTAQAFSVLTKHNATSVLADAIDAARVRAIELAKTVSE
jgi:pyrroline-5-carboxylate reductase